MFARHSASIGIVGPGNSFSFLSLMLLATLLTASGATTARAATGSVLTDAEARQVVDEHNRIRRDAGVSVAVSWDNDLARYAQEWADYLARNPRGENDVYHRPQPHPYGENIAYGYWTNTDAVRRWEAEKERYDGRAIEAEVPREREYRHYTQVIWDRTTRVGMGRASGIRGTIFVCNYSPAGNTPGQRPISMGLVIPPAREEIRFPIGLSTTIVNQTGQRMRFSVSGGRTTDTFDLEHNSSKRVILAASAERYINGHPESSSIHVNRQRLQPGKRHVARVMSAGAYRDAQGRTVSFSEVGWTVSN